MQAQLDPGSLLSATPWPVYSTQRDLVQTYCTLKQWSGLTISRSAKHTIKRNNITHFPILLPVLSRLPFLSFIFTCSTFFTNSVIAALYIGRLQRTEMQVVKRWFGTARSKNCISTTVLKLPQYSNCRITG
jgi:hypothetical protein